MKNYIILFCLALFFGCEKIPSGVVENTESSFQVLDVSAPIGFSYSSADSSFMVALRLSSGSDVQSLWADLYSPDNKQLNNSPITLSDNGLAANGDSQKGDNVFSGRISFSRNYSNGRYRIDYFVLTRDGISRKVAESSLTYDNKQTDYPPVLSNLVMPDSVNAADMFIFTVRVSDPNGLSDIKRVSFKFIRKEDNSVSGSADMWDDGNLQFHGDSVANDGIYSFKNSFTAETAGKTREFIFQAADKSDSLSNILTHNIYVK
ncbi:MAG TPA: hypothetical protein VHO03_19610 [Ignavibacteriales bacterium]|nr:hypothetical protein [Ignavibacteriales bacterium]